MDAVSNTPSAHTIDPSITDYKVADISLADYGRREITLAEAEVTTLTYATILFDAKTRLMIDRLQHSLALITLELFTVDHSGSAIRVLLTLVGVRVAVTTTSSSSVSGNSLFAAVLSVVAAVAFKVQTPRALKIHKRRKVFEEERGKDIVGSKVTKAIIEKVPRYKI